MARPWAEIAADPNFTGLPADKQEAARQAYFEQNVVPQLSPDQDVNDIKRRFDADTAPESFKRVIGLAGRAALQGVGDIADAPANLVSLASRGANYLWNKIPVYQGMTFGHDTMAEAADKQFNLPIPGSVGERVFSSAVEALPMGVAGGGVMAAGRAGAAVLSSMGNAAIANAVGGAAAQTAKESGVGATGQALAGMLAPMSTAGLAAGVRWLSGVRPGSVAANMSAAEASGVPLSAGQASGSPLLQKIEAVSKAYWGGTPLSELPRQQAAAVSNRIDQIVDNLSRGSDVSPTAAGEAITSGVNKTFLDMRRAEDAAYTRLADALPQGVKTPIAIDATAQKLVELTTPIPGAEAVSGSLINPFFKQLARKIETDLNSSTSPSGGTMPYAAVRQLRSMIGSNIDWGISPKNPAVNGGLKQLYGTLSADLRDGVGRANPAAAQAANEAASLYANNQNLREILGKVIDKAGGSEAVYAAATGNLKNGATTLRQVMGALPAEQQDIVRASFLDRLGRAVPSGQDAEGSVVSPETFLTNWNKLSPEAKTVLFGSPGDEGGSATLRRSLDSLTQTLATLRASQALKNPSGTAALATHTMGAGHMLHFLGVALTGGAGGFWAGTAAAVAPPIINNVVARALVNPATAQWLDRSFKVPPSAFPVMVNQLNRLAQNDPDAAMLAQLVNADKSNNE